MKLDFLIMLSFFQRGLCLIAIWCCVFALPATATEKKEDVGLSDAKTESATTDLTAEPTQRRSSFRPRPPLRNLPTPGSEHGLVDDYPPGSPPPNDYGSGYGSYGGSGFKPIDTSYPEPQGAYSPGGSPYGPSASGAYSPGGSSYGSPASGAYSPGGSSYGSPASGAYSPGGSPYGSPASGAYSPYSPPNSGSYGSSPYSPSAYNGYGSSPYSPPSSGGYGAPPPYSQNGGNYGASPYSSGGGYGGSQYSNGYAGSYNKIGSPSPQYNPPPPPPPPSSSHSGSGYGSQPYSPNSYGSAPYSPPPPQHTSSGYGGSSHSAGSPYTAKDGYRSGDYGNRGYLKIGSTANKDGHSKSPGSYDSYPKQTDSYRSGGKRELGHDPYARPYSSPNKKSHPPPGHSNPTRNYHRASGYDKPPTRYTSHSSKPYSPNSGYRSNGYHNTKPHQNPKPPSDYYNTKPANGYRHKNDEPSYDKYNQGGYVNYGKPAVYGGNGYPDPPAYGGHTKPPTGFGDYTKPDHDYRGGNHASPSPYEAPALSYGAPDAYGKNYGSITQRGYSKTYETYGTGRGYGDYGANRRGGLYGDHGLYGSASYGRNYALNYDIEEAKDYNADQAIYGGYGHVY